MERRIYAELLAEGQTLENNIRAYTAKVLQDLGTFIPANLASGVLIGAYFVEEVNKRLQKEIDAQ